MSQEGEFFIFVFLNLFIYFTFNEDGSVLARTSDLMHGEQGDRSGGEGD